MAEWSEESSPESPSIGWPSKETLIKGTERISQSPNEFIDPDFIPQSGIYEFGYRSGHPIQYFNNMSHGQNLSSI
jgi:hypothetical protein